MIRVWDPLVRVLHWSLVPAFVVAWLSAEGAQGLHEWAGYAAAALVAGRIVWGFVGTHYARFGQFVRGPGSVMAYLGESLRRREPRYLGHNPAGAVMIIAILITMAGTAFTGWLIDEPARQAMLPDLPRVTAPAFADDDEGGVGAVEGSEGALKYIHETLANVMLLLVALHLGGVVFGSVRHHENLVRAMVTGDKRAPGPGDIV